MNGLDKWVRNAPAFPPLTLSLFVAALNGIKKSSVVWLGAKRMTLLCTLFFVFPFSMAQLIGLEWQFAFLCRGKPTAFCFPRGAFGVRVCCMCLLRSKLVCCKQNGSFYPCQIRRRLNNCSPIGTVGFFFNYKWQLVAGIDGRNQHDQFCPNIDFIPVFSNLSITTPLFNNHHKGHLRRISVRVKRKFDQLSIGIRCSPLSHTFLRLFETQPF